MALNMRDIVALHPHQIRQEFCSQVPPNAPVCFSQMGSGKPRVSRWCHQKAGSRLACGMEEAASYITPLIDRGKELAVRQTTHDRESGRVQPRRHGAGEQNLRCVQTAIVNGIQQVFIHGLAAMELLSNHDDGLVSFPHHGKIQGAVSNSPDVEMMDAAKSIDQRRLGFGGHDKAI